MHFTVVWVNTSMLYNPINFKSFIENVSNAPLYKSVESKRRFEVVSLSGYNSQQLQKKTNSKDALVFYKDQQLLKNTGKNVVTMTMRCIYSLGDLEGNVFVRFFEPHKGKGQKKTSGNHSRVTCEFSFANNDKPGALVKTDEHISKYFDYVTKHVNNVLGQTSKTKQQTEAIFTSEMSLVSPKDGYVLNTKTIQYQKIQQIFKKIDEIVSKNGYEYDKVTNQKDGKKLAGKYFKPILKNGVANETKTRPTIAVFNTMRVQASGKYTMAQLRPIFKMFADAFKEASKDIDLSTSELKPPDLRVRTVSHCRKNTPEIKNGVCTGGRIPKVSKGNVCCYNESLFPGKAKKYVQDFVRLNIPIPKVYEKYKDSMWKVEKYKDEKKNAIRIAIKKGDEVVYKPWVCEKQKADEIKRVGKELLKLDMKGKKVDLCKRIETALNPIKPLPKKEKKARPPIYKNPALLKKGIRMRY